MQLSTIVLLSAVLVLVISQAYCLPVETELDQAAVQEFELTEHDSSPRNKRGLLLLKKKLLLGALGLKVAKIGAVGAAAGVALAKSKAHHAFSAPVVYHNAGHGSYGYGYSSWGH